MKIRECQLCFYNSRGCHAGVSWSFSSTYENGQHSFPSDACFDGSYLVPIGYIHSTYEIYRPSSLKDQIGRSDINETLPSERLFGGGKPKNQQKRKLFGL